MKYLKITALLIVLSILGACSTTSGGGYSRHEPSAASGDIESQRAQRRGEKECGRMPSYTNSGRSYTCDPQTRRWIPSDHVNKSEEEKMLIVEIERCIERYKRNGHRGSPTISCAQEMKRRYGNRRSYDQYGNQKNNFISLYKAKLVLVGYANCRAEIVNVRGIPRKKHEGQILEYGYKNNNLKVVTDINKNGQYHSRYHYFTAHEQTQFLVKLILPNNREVGPVWTKLYQYDENTDREDLTVVHAARAFQRGSRAAEVIESGCLINY